jgi:UDP-2-acetamido-2,6-beta-L-arabino-hexul-4-ose reductase
MKVALSGSQSFLGKNLAAQLRNKGCQDIIAVDDPIKPGNDFEKADIFFDLLTEYRSAEEESFKRINVDFVRNALRRYKGKKFVLISSARAGDGTPYGRSKLEAEELVLDWARDGKQRAYIYRLQNEFGKWCPPNLNSVVATFCYNLANGLPLTIHDASAPLELTYIDDLVTSFMGIIDNDISSGQMKVQPVYPITVGELANLLKEIAERQHGKQLPDVANPLIGKLYSTYLSYLPEGRARYPLETFSDYRGSFTELLHLGGSGQISVNITKPGITKGNHWHHSKTEKFIVVEGEASIKEREIGKSEVREYHVSGDRVEVVDMLPGYTHSITNIGEADLVTVIWANEIFDPENPDTYYEEI